MLLILMKKRTQSKVKIDLIVQNKLTVTIQNDKINYALIFCNKMNGKKLLHKFTPENLKN